MAERETIRVPSPAGGWAPPWPNVAEIAAVFGAEKWTLVGGLMVQLHAVHGGVGAVRPTADVDIVLHLEKRVRADEAAAALEGLGYALQRPLDPRTQTAHRFVRGRDVVDVLGADHAPPRVQSSLRGLRMVLAEGGTQALRRTVNADVEVTAGSVTRLSVPSVFGALMMKAAAHRTESRDPQRHLFDAVVLLACLDDPTAALEWYSRGDRRRVRHLGAQLTAEHPAWFVLGERERRQARLALRILVAGL